MTLKNRQNLIKCRHTQRKSDGARETEQESREREREKREKRRMYAKQAPRKAA